jgi:hypothetical protein
MAEMGEVCGCDGVMDRITSILRFSTERCAGRIAANGVQTDIKRISNGRNGGKLRK